MQVNNTFDCYKPKRISTFKGENPESSGRKVRYKHYEQMDEDTLSLHSVVKAHKDVEKSAKMRLFKAMPHITTALLGTTIAITQPGKLAAKAGAGLGFLALSQLISFAEKKARNINLNKNEDGEKGSIIPKTLDAAKNVAIAVAGVSMVGALVKSGTTKKVQKFVKRELSQIAKEINESKIGKRVNNFISESSNKNKKTLSALEFLAPLGVISAGVATELKLADSLSEDIKEKASANYLKGKLAQQQAREHFDSIDAQEV